jgi:outer membrane protein TolC
MDHSRPIRMTFLMGLCAAAAGMTASCMLGPDYVRPAVEVPASYKSAGMQPTAQGAGRVIPAWWTLYDDPVLTQLEEAAQMNNPDLKAAVFRVTQARAVAAQTHSQLFPQIALNPTLTATVRPTGKPTTLTQIPLDLSYEIDLWGQVA